MMQHSYDFGISYRALNIPYQPCYVLVLTLHTYVPYLSLYVAPFVPPFWHQSQINSSRVEVFLSRPSLISLSLPFLSASYRDLCS